jgi:hypothetical protein
MIKIKNFFLNQYTVKINIRDASNKNIFIKISEDYKIMKKNKFKF